MTDKNQALLALSLLITPFALPSSPPQDISFTSASENAPTKSSHRAAARRMRYELETAPKLEPRGIYVGELQEKWTFPSDHLPIGMTFQGVHFASWNVLDAAYMDWVIEKNSQGLSRSLIADEHVYIEDSQLTVRDRHVVDLVLEMISHPTHPRSVLSLQECSKPFLEELGSRLPGHFAVISHHGDAVLVDKRCFAVVDAKEVVGVFRDAPYRTFQDITLERLSDGQKLRVLNAHLPGDPTKPARFEFTHYLAQTFDSSVATIAMGDMNFDELKMSEALTQAFLIHPPFSLYSPYCTDISPYVFKSKAIDHFLVYSPDQSPVTLNAPNEVMSNLSSMVSLLEGLLQEDLVDPIADFAQKNCLNEGTLEKIRDYVYLKLQDEYLRQIFEKIKGLYPDAKMPSFHGDIGPHISIIRHDEWKGSPIQTISELGMRYIFNPVRIDVVETAHKRLWVLVVELSPELAAVRGEYAVGDMPHGHEFHVTLAQESL